MSNNRDVILDAMQNPSSKILLSTGLSINGDNEIVILNFLQALPNDMNGGNMPVIARIAVTPSHLKAYINMLQAALAKIEQAKKEEE